MTGRDSTLERVAPAMAWNVLGRTLRFGFGLVISMLLFRGLGEFDFGVLSITEDGNTVSIYYEYKKSAKTMTIAQLFRFKEQRIGEIILVFDTK